MTQAEVFAEAAKSRSDAQKRGEDDAASSSDDDGGTAAAVVVVLLLLFVGVGVVSVCSSCSQHAWLSQARPVLWLG